MAKSPTVVALVCGAALAGAAGAQEPTLDPAARRAVADTVAAQVERVYVDADTGRLIADVVRRRLRAGAYDAAAEPTRLAQLLTEDLRSVNGDLHLGVAWTPPAAAGVARSPTPFADRSQHYALGRVDVLPGNVGYLAIDGFSGDLAARDVVVAALRYLEPTDALVLDLRRNRGGSASLVNFLVSHFTGPDTVASVVVRARAGGVGGAGGGRAFTRYTLASVPGPRRPDVPLYVLTSRGTGSAGEDFAFVLQNMRRATLVGDRTAGAGHNVTFLPAGHGFRTGISVTRVSDPRTGREWERVGVQPDVRADVATADLTAHALALRALAARADGARRRQLEGVAEVVEARLRPRAVPAATLAAYAGEYEGGRRVTVTNGTLAYAPLPGLPPEPLVALGDSTFALPSTQARLVFSRDARGAVRLRALAPDGGTATFARADATRAAPSRD